MIDYRCDICGARNCKLWRLYNTFLCYQRLYCVCCAGADQEKDVSEVDADGRRKSEVFEGDGCRTDQIGWLIPAVPDEDFRTYWGYSSVPDEGVRWWRALPTYPEVTVPAWDELQSRLPTASRIKAAWTSLAFNFQNSGRQLRQAEMSTL